MNTQILATATPEERALAVATAVDLLREGEAVALPTETVYGLAADALAVSAALNIFEAKERPSFDPLIVHLPDSEWLARLTRVAPSDAALVSTLTKNFWPGPLTLVLPRRAIVPDVVTAGLETVAVRMSAHPVFTAVVRAFGRPLAAPSANRFGRISPTAATHVASELSGRIPLILDGGAATYGLESTIVAVRGGAMEILRHGPVTREQLTAFGTVRDAVEQDRPEAPGQLPSHYAPRTPLVLTDNLASFHIPAGKRAAGLSLRPVEQG
ncbi:MAG: L-threonylcarbamoyladenylate synthase, partial [Verrucomicrobiota bacterium]|nr:L-threonylcarbamoyladenylate synthase [Verrucomicrobiota bacterium]